MFSISLRKTWIIVGVTQFNTISLAERSLVMLKITLNCVSPKLIGVQLSWNHRGFRSTIIEKGVLIKLPALRRKQEEDSHGRNGLAVVN
jgi:hypothetical protein